MWRIIKLKKFWIPLLIVLVAAGWFVYESHQQAAPQYTTDTVKRQDLYQTVTVTGTVKAAEQVDLNFKLSGRLTRVNAKIGEQVKVGAVLAQLEAGDAQAAVLTAQANLKSAEATLDKLNAGAQAEDIAVSQANVKAARTTLQNAQQSLINTKSSQAQAVTNALAQLVGLPAAAVPAKSNTSTVTIAVSGTYSSAERGSYTIRLDNPINLQYSVYGLETVIGTEGSRTTPTALATRGLKLQFSSSGTFVQNDTWTVEIPNTANSSYSIYQAAYDAALTTLKQQVDTAEATVKSAEQAWAQTEAQLTYKMAPARSFDVLAAEAQVASAQAALLKAKLDLQDRAIIAPVNGTVTQVNNQVGENVGLNSAVIVLLADSQAEIKVQVPESDIAKLAVAQTADITLDAFGSADHFSGHISFIEPASTVIQDVVYYQVTVLFDNTDDRLKPGMTANLDIQTGAVKNVLVVPLRGVKYDNGRAYVELLDSNKQVERRNVTTGLKGDDGLTEVRAGLRENESVITYKSNGGK
ncbi:MAG: efflux RND transporter periplasmic adaptor subunit [Patescibacteria group bacterium]